MFIPLKINFDPQKCFILLNIEKPSIPPNVLSEAEKLQLEYKKEFHISIVVTTNARTIRGKMDDKNDTNLWHQIEESAKSFKWEYSLKSEYFLMKKFYSEQELIDSGYTNSIPHLRKTIIQLVDLPDLNKFYSELCNLTNLSFTIPIPHVTLFSWSDNPSYMTRGIGISSKEDFDKTLDHILSSKIVVERE